MGQPSCRRLRNEPDCRVAGSRSPSLHTLMVSTDPGQLHFRIGTNPRSRSETPRMPCRPFVRAKWREARRPREPGKADPPRRTTGPAAPARLRMTGEGLTAEERPQRTTGPVAPPQPADLTAILLLSPPRRSAPP